MATSSCTNCFILNKSHPSYPKTTSDLKNGTTPRCSFLPTNTNLKLLQKTRGTSYKGRRSNMELTVRNVTPEASGDLLSSFSIPGLSLPGDNPWIAGIAGLAVTVPLLIQRLSTLAKEVDMAAEAVEKIADTVGKVAEEVDKAAEDLAEALPEGGLKRIVSSVEDLAEETVKDAQKVEDLMDKVEELDDKLEAILKKQSNDTEKA